MTCIWARVAIYPENMDSPDFVDENCGNPNLGANYTEFNAYDFAERDNKKSKCESIHFPQLRRTDRNT